jgi:hypothetical protein
MNQWIKIETEIIFQYLKGIREPTNLQEAIVLLFLFFE